MHAQTDTNAMTEVALALAMAFFSLMVLGMVSMSVPLKEQIEDQLIEQGSSDTMSLNQSKGDGNAVEGFAEKKQYIFYFDGKFFDQQLSSIEPEKISATKELVLAIPKNLPVSEALKLKSVFLSSNPLITTINEQWQKRLESL